MKHLKSEHGQSLVELAISILILVYLLAGAVEFGLAFFQYVQLRDAAQEGALYGSMNPSDSANIELRTRNASTSPVNLLDTGIVTVTQTIIGSPCEGNGIQVTVSYNHQIFMPFIPEFIGSSTIPLNATVTDTILSPVCP
ncbi:MAG TPA: TadE/TadG family type IV pilus assembly protein [Anaerolineales bacterium]|jgi:Flp pilus assembly protein TadG|nr:TadE/TadG family type IV pilus assembly protein [Anaerolineales bacterium]